MKKIAKKTMAILLATLMLVGFSVISSADNDAVQPTVKIQNNQETPAAEGDNTVELALTAENLSGVTGMDFTVTAPAGVAFGGLTGSFKDGSGADQITLTLNDNYTLSATEIHIVSAFVQKPVSSLSATITFTCSNIGSYVLPITVKFTNNDTNVAYYAEGTYVSENGKLVIGKSELKTTSDGTVDIPANGFLPYGAVYRQADGKYIYPIKNADGSFDLSGATYSYKYFLIPQNGVSTFSSSRKNANPSSALVQDQSNGIQFVSYGTDKAKDYGTFLVKGDIDGFCKSKGLNKTGVFEHLTEIINMENGKWYSTDFTNPNKGGEDTIYFSKVVREAKMWSKTGTGSDCPIQFALRVYNVENSDLYTACAYVMDGYSYVFSEAIQSRSFGS